MYNQLLQTSSPRGGEVGGKVCHQLLRMSLPRGGEGEGGARQGGVNLRAVGSREEGGGPHGVDGLVGWDDVVIQDRFQSGRWG